jgi:sucrose-6-phosphate hydrolase SacC (GH32 family)
MAGGKFPEMPFNQQMSIPCELMLRKFPKGIRLCRVPVREIAKLRSLKYSLKNAPLPAGQNASSYLSAELFEIQAEIELGTASEVGFTLRGNDLVYSVDENTLSCRGQKMKMAPANGRIRLTILTDRTSIEVFCPDSWMTMHLCFPLDPDNTSLELFARGGQAEIRSLKLWTLKSIWPGG